MRSASALLAFGLAVAAAGTHAQAPVSSPAPDRVAVTVYRDPHRSPSTAPNLRWLNGYALISETRTVSIPAGESEIRFVGVAGGIVTQSAIVSGFPEGIVERNRDAYLLSPATLVDRSLGRRVHLRRTSLATGAVREQEAVIRSGRDGAVVLETGEGFEALRCTGLAETLVFPEVPAGLSATPTLSVRTRSSRPVTATVTLSYLASGFDWQANYVATLSPDGNRVDLFAWLTLVNGDQTSFANADTQAVAGRLNREWTPPQPSEGGPLQLTCWPSGTTSDLPLEREEEGAGFYPPAPPPPPPPVMAAAEAITVTGSRIMAQEEALGDVKLYRIPEPVTVAAQSQKQVAFLDRSGVSVEIVHRHRIDPETDGPVPAGRFLVTRNRSASGLGVPLPAGRLVLFGGGRDRPILLGEGSLSDRAVGEDVEIRIGESTGVHVEAVRVDGKTGEVLVTVTNSLPTPARFEATLPAQQVVSRTRLGRRDGMPFWSVTVPANGRATLRYRPEG